MFSKKNINNVPIEGTSHSTGSRKMIVSQEEISSDFFEAFTYGYLPSNENWSLHKHENIVEICIVISGEGIIKDKNGNLETFEPGDRFIFSPNTEHMIENTSGDTAEFYFLRLKVKI